MIVNPDCWEIEQAIRLLQEALPRISDALSSPTIPPPSYDDRVWPAYPYNDLEPRRNSCYSRSGLNSELNDPERMRRPCGGRYSIVDGSRGYNKLPSKAIRPVSDVQLPEVENTPLFNNNISNEAPSALSNTNGLCGCNKYSKIQILTLISMLLLDVTSFAAMSILAPFFPSIIKKKELSSTINGIILSTYGFVVMVSSPLVGILVPKMTPRICYLTGIFLSAVSNFCFGLVYLIENNILFVAVCVILRALSALGSSCFFIVIYGIVPILYPEDVSTVTGMMETAIGVGMCIGPAIGGWLYSVGGFGLPFFALGGFLFLVFPVSWFIFPDTELMQATGKINVKKLLCRASIIRPGVVLVVSAICCTGLYPTLQPHMHSIGLKNEYVALIYVLESAVYSICAPLVGLAIDKWNCPSLVTGIGLLLATIGLILLGSSPILPMEPHEILLKQDVISMIVLGLSSAMSIVPTFAEMLTAAQKGSETTDLAISSFVGGLWSCSYSFGETIGPFFTGILSDYFDFASTTSIMALLPLTLVSYFFSIIFSF